MKFRAVHGERGMTLVGELTKDDLVDFVRMHVHVPDAARGGARFYIEGACSYDEDVTAYEPLRFVIPVTIDPASGADGSRT